MTPEERETLVAIARVVADLSRSLAYIDLAVQDLVAGENVRAEYSVNQGRPTLTLVHADA